MTFTRLSAVRSYWTRHPRVDWLKAKQLGYKSPSRVKTDVQPGTDLVTRFGLRPGAKYRE